MADFFDLLNQLQINHPDIFALLSKPGIFKVVTDMMAAEQAGQPWTQARIDAALQATPYYQQSDAQVRAWDTLLATDPASAHTKIEATKRIIDDLQKSLGIKFSDEGGLNSMAFGLLTNAVTYGWTPDQIKYNMLASVNKSITGGGDLGKAAADIKKEFDDYGVPMSDKAVMDWAMKLQQGAVDAAAITGYAQEQAKSLFPGLADAISRGISVRQYATPFLQIAQQELGIDTDNISLTDPKWMAALNQVDAKTGQRVSMNLSDWTAKIRNDPTYGYDQTTQASTQAAGFAKRLSEMFGATG